MSNATYGHPGVLPSIPDAKGVDKKFARTYIGKTRFKGAKNFRVVPLLNNDS